MKSYQNLLSSPKWQRKRLEVLNKSNFTCEVCGDNEATLHVHHKRYVNKARPWDTPDELLISLCESCHKQEHARLPISLKKLTEVIREKYLSSDIDEITEGFAKMPTFHLPEVEASVLKFMLSDVDCLEYAKKKYFKLVKDRVKELNITDITEEEKV